MTRGERVIAFIERFCLTPEGPEVGKPIKLDLFQKKFLLDVFDNPAGTRRAYLSLARKNGKTALIACILLSYLCGPEAVQNAQIISGARSRDQAGIIFDLASKMVRLSSELSKLLRIVPSSKRIIGLARNVEYRALSAEAGTAHGLSPLLAILDEVGQVRGPRDDFIDAITTAQGAHSSPLLIAISTQAPTDADLFSIWLDDALKGIDPQTICHLYAAPDNCDLLDRDAWRAANPALGVFRSMEDVERQAAEASRMPSAENTFRNLILNQRVDTNSPFISREVWARNSSAPVSFGNAPVFAGLDLSSTSDLTAFVAMAYIDGCWHVRPTFWLPKEGLNEKSARDRVPYNLWHDQGYLETTPGRAIRYEFVAKWIYQFCSTHNVKCIGFDRYNIRHLRPWLEKAGFTDAEIDARFRDYGQGFVSMSPALRTLEELLLSDQMAHGGHPVLTMCAANAIVKMDEAGNRKLNKAKASGRIDGMVALAMAVGVAPEKQSLVVPEIVWL